MTDDICIGPCVDSCNKLGLYHIVAIVISAAQAAIIIDCVGLAVDAFVGFYVDGEGKMTNN